MGAEVRSSYASEHWAVVALCESGCSARCTWFQDPEDMGSIVRWCHSATWSLDDIARWKRWRWKSDVPASGKDSTTAIVTSSQIASADGQRQQSIFAVFRTDAITKMSAISISQIAVCKWSVDALSAPLADPVSANISA
jgi:hypothetical protein